jgi:hypothetical protein
MFLCQSETQNVDRCFQIGCGSYVAPLILLHVEILENTFAECRGGGSIDAYPTILPKRQVYVKYKHLYMLYWVKISNF